MPLSPFSGYLTLAFLAGVLILMYFDEQHGPWMIAATVIGVPALIGGWYLVRNRVTAVAHHAIDHTKSVAVVHSADQSEVHVDIATTSQVAALNSLDVGHCAQVCGRALPDRCGIPRHGQGLEPPPWH